MNKANEDELEYKLEIGAYRPETIPMSRLSEYLSDLANLLGESQSVHFSGTESGSTVVCARVEKEAVPKVRQRVMSIARGDLTSKLVKIYNDLDKRLESDNASGVLYEYHAKKSTKTKVVEFAGCKRQKPIDYGVVREAGVIDGVPVRIGGQDKTAHVILIDGARTYTSIEMTRELAERISDDKCLFRKTIRLRGIGRWWRDEEGLWQLKGFKAVEYEILGDQSLADALSELRDLEGGWADIDDPITYLESLR